MPAKSTDKPDQLLSFEGHWNFRYQYYLGDTASHFFQTIRDDAQILGRTCDTCDRVLVPPRSFCDRCFRETAAWKPVGPLGTVDTFTILNAVIAGFADPPVIVAYVTLDGADTAIANYILGVDLTDIDATGRELATDPPRVRLVFSDHREGSIRDFHFELADD